MSAHLDEVLLRQSLDAAGLTEVAAARYRSLLDDAHEALDAGGVGRDGRRAWIAPGRIEVLGKHVDYAGGRSLLCTVERGIVMVVRPRNDGVVTVRDARRREVLTLPVHALPKKGQVPWSVYPRTVIQRLVHNFGDAVRGADIALASNLPPAAGVSSSSALTVGLTSALTAISDINALPAWRTTITDRAAFAGYVGALENGTTFGALTGERGVGTMGGAQDQTAILCSAPGRLDVFAWAPVRHERSVPWPATHCFVVGVSGVIAAKTGSAKERYNRAARTAHHLVAAWNAGAGMPEPARTLREAFEQAALQAGPDGIVGEVPSSLIDTARRSATDEFSAHHLVARLEQFFDETYALVPGAAEALNRGDVAAFGAVVDRSQAGAERALENQIAETVHLQRYARELGANAASAFGAGFGGSVWAMISRDDAETFMGRWRDRYQRVHPKAAARATFFVTSPSPPVFEVVDA